MGEKPFSLAVRAIIKDEQGLILIVRRSAACKHFAGSWELPGGKVEKGEKGVPGESFDQALTREVTEETGLTISLERAVGASQHEMTAARVVSLFMEARLQSGEVRLSDEHDEYRWVTRDELAGMPMNEQMREFVRDYVTRQTH